MKHLRLQRSLYWTHKMKNVQTVPNCWLLQHDIVVFVNIKSVPIAERDNNFSTVKKIINFFWSIQKSMKRKVKWSNFAQKVTRLILEIIINLFNIVEFVIKNLAKEDILVDVATGILVNLVMTKLWNEIKTQKKTTNANHVVKNILMVNCGIVV